MSNTSTQPQTWLVVRVDWFGDSDTVKACSSRAEAVALARSCRASSKAVDDPADRIRYRVERETRREIKLNG